MTARDDTPPSLSELRHVLIVITGGTICMQESSDGLVPTKGFLQNCMQPSPDFNDGSAVVGTHVIDEHGEPREVPTLVASIRGRATTKYKYSVLEFANVIDSSSMDGSNWNQVLKSICHNWADFDAFVVLHGTDTLAYTASALAFMLGEVDKTVVVTGSQLSMYAPSNDAHDNLLDCLTVAALYDISEVSVVFHHHLYRATRVTKVSAYSMAAFTTPNAKPLASLPKATGKSWAAHIYSGSIRSASENALPRKADGIRVAKASSQGVVDTSRVAVLKVYPGISGNLIGSIVSIPDLGGLIIETFGAGNIPLGTGNRNLLEILSSAVNNGIVVISVTQCLTGSVTSAYESARRMERNGIVTGLDMTTEAAYTKLAFLLSQPDLSYENIVEKMRQNLCGELTADFKEGQRRRDSIGERPRELRRTANDEHIDAFVNT